MNTWWSVPELAEAVWRELFAPVTNICYGEENMLADRRKTIVSLLPAEATPFFLSKPAETMGMIIFSSCPACTSYTANRAPSIHRHIGSTDWENNRSGRAAEDPEMVWHFWVRHYRNETQARRDSKFTYLLEDGSWYTGLDPPEGAEPYRSLLASQ